MFYPIIIINRIITTIIITIISKSCDDDGRDKKECDNYFIANWSFLYMDTLLFTASHVHECIQT